MLVVKLFSSLSTCVNKGTALWSCYFNPIIICKLLFSKFALKKIDYISSLLLSPLVYFFALRLLSHNVLSAPWFLQGTPTYTNVHTHIHAYTCTHAHSLSFSPYASSWLRVKKKKKSISWKVSSLCSCCLCLIKLLDELLADYACHTAFGLLYFKGQRISLSLFQNWKMQAFDIRERERERLWVCKHTVLTLFLFLYMFLGLPKPWNWRCMRLPQAGGTLGTWWILGVVPSAGRRALGQVQSIMLQHTETQSK